MDTQLINFKLELKHKKTQLKDLMLNTFTYNPEISFLAQQINDLEEKIIALGGELNEEGEDIDQ